MKSTRSRYHGHRFPPEIIGYAVWVYHRFCLSFRDVEDLLAERGIIVSYEAIRRWCWKFGPDYARRLKKKQGRDNGELLNWATISDFSGFDSMPGCAMLSCFSFI
jgi:putative transposase